MVESKTGKNPWEDITVDSLLRSIDKTNPWKSNQAYVSPEDRDYVRKYNLRLGVSDNDDYRFHLELPPEPWQGNPLKAKVIILTLNPGYVESANTVIAKLLKKADCLDDLLRFKENVLKLKVGSLMPEIKEKTDSDSNEITTFEAFNALGDWYWVEKLRHLKGDYLKIRTPQGCTLSDKERVKLENKFYKNFAVLEYCAYTSKSYKDFPGVSGLPSVKYAQDLLKEIIAKENKVIVVLRKRWEQFMNNRPYITVKSPKCQYLTPGNVGEEEYNIILNALD